MQPMPIDQDRRNRSTRADSQEENSVADRQKPERPIASSRV
jgi:hypothetical protein